MFSELFFFIWDCMHILTLAIEPRDAVLHPGKKAAIIKLVEGIIALLPCSACAAHAVQYYYLQNRLNPNTGREAFEWTVEFHNHVNEQCGKRRWTPKEAEESLEKRFGIHGELKDMLRAEVKHKEADAKIKQLQAEIALYEQLLIKNQISVDKQSATNIAQQHFTSNDAQNNNIDMNNEKKQPTFVQRVKETVQHTLKVNDASMIIFAIMSILIALLLILLFFILIVCNMVSLRKHIAITASRIPLSTTLQQ